LKDKARVALWEVHPDHPKSTQYPAGGEIFVTGEGEHKVAETPGVLRALREEKIVKAGGEMAGAKKVEPPVR
jgi:hypothetical protein